MRECSLEGGTLDAADRTALDTWLAASPQHRALEARQTTGSTILLPSS